MVFEVERHGANQLLTIKHKQVARLPASAVAN
jgi:hypothetical protein